MKMPGASIPLYSIVMTYYITLTVNSFYERIKDEK